MSYTNQTTTNVADLIAKLNTFLSGTPGWTTHHVPASGEFAARKTGAGFDIGFAAQWSTASPNALGIYHFHGAAYNSGASPWAQNDDSGSGAASTVDTTLDNERHVILTSTPIQFWCFEDDDYFHVVVESSAGRFWHFGAGYLDKFNDWTGGEYVYGQTSLQTFTSSIPTRPNATYLLDGRAADLSPIFNMEDHVATIHCEGLDGMGGSAKYGVVMGNQPSASLGQDRQGSPQNRAHLFGDVRGGLIGRNFSQFAGTVNRGLIPLTPITVGLWNRSNNNITWPLGQMKDVRIVNVRSFAAGEEVTIGSDTWTIFPAHFKATSDSDNGSSNFHSGYLGFAYKKVTT